MRVNLFLLFQMERYIRTQSTPPGMPAPSLQQQLQQPQQQRPPQQQAPPQAQQQPTSQFVNSQGMRKVIKFTIMIVIKIIIIIIKVPSNASLDRVITTAKMVALQSK